MANRFHLTSTALQTAVDELIIEINGIRYTREDPAKKIVLHYATANSITGINIELALAEPWRIRARLHGATNFEPTVLLNHATDNRIRVLYVAHTGLEIKQVSCFIFCSL